MKKTLAIDMGATSIRAILGYIDMGELVTEEVMRFNHVIKDIDGRKQWDLEGMLSKIENTILEYKDEIETIGVDTWGVDFGLIDKVGSLIYNPTSYRDESCEIGFKSMKEKIDFSDLFKKTGNQIMSINTLFQLETVKIENNNFYEKADKLLMTPDLINYLLTGKKYGERTICSTSQMFDLKAGDWNRKLVKDLGLNEDLLPEIINNKIVIGSTKNSLIGSLRDLDIKVISVASHDTASAVYVTESYTNEDCLFLSSGTWSLIGCCNDKPILTDQAYNYSLTNETGYDNKNMFFKNVTGLYLIEKLRDHLVKKDKSKFSFDEITNLVENSTISDEYIIDVDYEVFTKESNNFIYDLDKYFEEKENKVIKEKTDYFKIIYQSIVENYKSVVENIERCLGKKFTKIHVMGGGSQSKVLCQMIADKLKIKVIAGPKEATAVGNILSQLEYMNEKENIRQIVTDGFKTVEYLPIIK